MWFPSMGQLHAEASMCFAVCLLLAGIGAAVQHCIEHEKLLGNSGGRRMGSQRQRS
jgi:hypothetical protein